MAEVQFNQNAERAFKKTLEKAAEAAIFGGGAVYLRGLREEISVSVQAGVSPLTEDQKAGNLVREIASRQSKPKKVSNVKKSPVNKSAVKVSKHSSKKTPKAGKRKRNKKKTIIRSLPGQPPRKETGDLFRAWNVRKNPGGATVGADSSAPYANWLETGTRKMKARPYIVVSYDKHKERIRAIIILVLIRKFG